MGWQAVCGELEAYSVDESTDLRQNQEGEK